MREFLDMGGEIHACSTCLKFRGGAVTDMYRIANLADLYKIVTQSDKVLSF